MRLRKAIKEFERSESDVQQVKNAHHFMGLEQLIKKYPGGARVVLAILKIAMFLPFIGPISKAFISAFIATIEKILLDNQLNINN